MRAITKFLVLAGSGVCGLGVAPLQDESSGQNGPHGHAIMSACNFAAEMLSEPSRSIFWSRKRSTESGRAASSQTTRIWTKRTTEPAISNGSRSVRMCAMQCSPEGSAAAQCPVRPTVEQNSRTRKFEKSGHRRGRLGSARLRRSAVFPNQRSNLSTRGSTGAPDPSEWPADLRVRQYPERPGK